MIIMLVNRIVMLWRNDLWGSGQGSSRQRGSRCQKQQAAAAQTFEVQVAQTKAGGGTMDWVMNLKEKKQARSSDQRTSTMPLR